MCPVLDWRCSCCHDSLAAPAVLPRLLSWKHMFLAVDVGFWGCRYAFSLAFSCCLVFRGLPVLGACRESEVVVLWTEFRCLQRHSFRCFFVLSFSWGHFCRFSGVFIFDVTPICGIVVCSFSLFLIITFSFNNICRLKKKIH